MIYDIASLKRKVLSSYPFFGSIAADVECWETDEIETIKSDGTDIFYNPQYLSGLSDNDQIFLLSHELCHIALEHASRGKDKDPVIWHTAADAVINQMLKRDGLSIIKGGVDYPEAIDYDAEQYYEILLKEKLEIELLGGQLEGEENPTGNESGGDQDAPEKDDNDDDQDSEAEQQLIQGDEKKQDEDDSDDEEDLVERIESDAGNSIRRDIRTVSEIGTAPPIIDWRILLRDTVNHDVDWSYTNAVIEDDGLVRPVLKEIAIPETEIVLDTSWSVDEELLRNFLRECKNILHFSKLKAGCFDTEFYGFQDIQTEQDIEEMVFEGGGGTDFNTAVEAFTLHVDNRIIFTDGEGPEPDNPLNAIWVTYGDNVIEPPGGTVIHIKPEQLKKTIRPKSV